MLCSSTRGTPAPMNIPPTVAARCRRPASPSELDVVASCKKARCSMASPGPNKSSCPLQLSVSLFPANHLPYPSKNNLSHKKSRWLVATKILAGPSKNERRLQQKKGPVVAGSSCRSRRLEQKHGRRRRWWLLPPSLVPAQGCLVAAKSMSGSGGV